jgi:predicted metal-dependent HD superfamily phosphohydrolase
MLREQWVATWGALGVAAPEGVFEELLARYGEPQRHYHTARHLEECFAQLPAVRDEAERPGEVELALWFHDAIYDTKRQDNEERSAEWARAVVAKAGLGASVGERVAALIMSTRHDAVPADTDSRIVVDVDLSILGAPPLRFDEYEHDVRDEYGWVPNAVFRRERRKILGRLLSRGELFNTPRMREAFEQRARANLERSLVRLQPDLRPASDVAMAVVAVAMIFGLGGGSIIAPVWAAAAGAGTWLLYALLIRPRLRRPPLFALPRKAPVDSRYAVRCDDEGVSVMLDDKPLESMRWADVTAVLIRINESFLPQPWWVLVGRGGKKGCMYPSDARGADRALEILPSRFAGFDHAAVIKAMGLTAGGVVVWDEARATRRLDSSAE